MRGFSYLFRRSTDNIGVGVQDIAFVPPHLSVGGNIYGPGYNVRKDFVTMGGAFMQTGQRIAPVSILGTTGTGMAGDFALTPLAIPARGN